MKKKLFFLTGFLLLCGCSVSYYEKSADREVSSILNEKSKIAQKGKIISLQEDTRNETIFLS
ncbi:MAG: hypothetical protein NC937_06595, partial [Candidatus Omnitrophica bacterium]|nr:hypothetical protein [Candidatus Omnitrophota bacterium]